MSNQSPHISIRTPFESVELPTLFCWLNRVRASVADDSMPIDLYEWMDYQRCRLATDDITTFGLYKAGQLRGYCEIVHPVSPTEYRLS
jgi:hypothetical protein